MIGDCHQFQLSPISKITYFSEYVQPKGDYGYGNNLKPVHFFDRDCDLYDFFKKVEVIEDFKIKK